MNHRFDPVGCLIGALVAFVLVAVFVLAAAQTAYCVHYGDPSSPRYYAVCESDD